MALNEQQLLRSSINAAVCELANRGLHELVGVSRAEETGTVPVIDSDEIRRDIEASNLNSLPSPSVAAVASAVAGPEVFRMASKRVRATFRLNFVVATTLVTVFVASLVSAIICAFITGDNWWAVAFGGVAIADIAGILVFNPLQRLDRAMVVCNMLEILYVRYLDATVDCEEIEELDGRIKCLKSAWSELRKEVEKVVKTY
ncbi:MAG TPA: hypothetical protein DIT97_04765 [Gimesia maris]|uniref:SMODS and SLOG-associating 2TM effector domain-containing protein n=1 Tax=Gimesia maris TaxID=122 RepID=A0A3D3R0N2_9PLAN|nr:hypothetical protein [Gimesia maris]|tara:strand:- start:46439 stop:47044 length:606 start_codon:yes stop_codon:yes gene_type:complete